MVRSQVPAIVAEVEARGQMLYADVIGMFEYRPNSVEMDQLRKALDFSLRLDEAGNVQHIVSAKQGGE